LENEDFLDQFVGSGVLGQKDQQVSATNDQLLTMKTRLDNLTNQCNENAPLIVELDSQITNLLTDQQTLTNTPTPLFLTDLATRLGIPVTPVVLDLIVILTPLLQGQIDTKTRERDQKIEICQLALTEKTQLSGYSEAAELIVSQLGETIRVGERATLNISAVQQSLDAATNILNSATASTGYDFSTALVSIATGENLGNGAVSGTDTISAAPVTAGVNTSNLGGRGIASSQVISANDFFNTEALQGSNSESTVTPTPVGNVGIASGSSQPNPYTDMQLDFNGTPIGVQKSAIFETLSGAYDRAELY